jgi:hypothetical protein
LVEYGIFPTSGRGLGQSKPKPSQSQSPWLGLEILEAKATQSQAKATGFWAKPSQNITIHEARVVSRAAFFGVTVTTAPVVARQNRIENVAKYLEINQREMVSSGVANQFESDFALSRPY